MGDVKKVIIKNEKKSRWGSITLFGDPIFFCTDNLRIGGNSRKIYFNHTHPTGGHKSLLQR